MMDISIIKSDQVTTEGGIDIGHPEAPVTIFEFSLSLLSQMVPQIRGTAH